MAELPWNFGSLIFSPSGDLVAHSDGNVEVRSLRNPTQPLLRVAAQNPPADYQAKYQGPDPEPARQTRIQFLSGGPRILVMQYGLVRIWDLAPLLFREAESAGGTGLDQFQGSDGRHLVAFSVTSWSSGMPTSRLRVLNRASGEYLLDVGTESGYFPSASKPVRFTPDGRFLIAMDSLPGAERASALRGWELGTGKPLAVPEYPTSSMQVIAGANFVTGADEVLFGSGKVYWRRSRTANAKAYTLPLTLDAAVRTVHFPPTLQQPLVEDERGRYYTWTYGTGTPQTLPDTVRGVKPVLPITSRPYLLTGPDETTVRMICAVDGTPLAPDWKHPARVFSVHQEWKRNPNDNHIGYRQKLEDWRCVTLAADGKRRVWSRKSAEPLETTADVGPIQHYVFANSSPNSTAGGFELPQLRITVVQDHSGVVRVVGDSTALGKVDGPVDEAVIVGKALLVRAGGVIHFWPDRDHPQQRTTIPHPGKVREIATLFDPSQARLITIGADDLALVWDLQKPDRPVLRVPGTREAALFVGGVAVRTIAGRGQLWFEGKAEPTDVGAAASLHTTHGYFTQRDRINRHIVLADPEGRLRLVDVVDPKSPALELAHGGPISHVSTHRNALGLTTVGADGTIRVWNFIRERNAATGQFTPHGDPVKLGEPVRILQQPSTSGRILLITESGRRILFDENTREVVIDFHGDRNDMVAMFERHYWGSSVLFVACTNGALKRVEVGRKESVSLGVHGSRIWAADFLPFSEENKNLFCTQSDRFWMAHLETGERVSPVFRHDSPIDRVLRHGSHLLVIGSEGTSRVYDGGTGLPVGPPVRFDGEVLDVGSSHVLTRKEAWALRQDGRLVRLTQFEKPLTEALYLNRRPTNNYPYALDRWLVRIGDEARVFEPFIPWAKSKGFKLAAGAAATSEWATPSRTLSGNFGGSFGNPNSSSPCRECIPC